MRKEFVECKSKTVAYNECPWASVFIRVTGGYMCFESYSDYRMWLNQK